MTEDIDPVVNIGARMTLLRHLDDQEWLDWWDFISDFENDGDQGMTTNHLVAEQKIEWMRIAKREGIASGEIEAKEKGMFIRLTAKGLAARDNPNVAERVSVL